MSNSSDVPYLIPASLLSPKSIHPIQPPPSPPPRPAANASCADLSLTPSWIVEAFFFSPTPYQMGMEVTTWSNIARLNVTNRVTGLRTDCTVFPSYGGDNAGGRGGRGGAW